MKATLPAVSDPPPNVSEASTSALPRLRRIVARGSARAVVARCKETRSVLPAPTLNVSLPLTPVPVLPPHRLTAQDADALLHAVVACLQGCVRGAFSATPGDCSDLEGDLCGTVEVMLDVVTGNARYRLVRTPLVSDTDHDDSLPDGSSEVRFGEALSPREREIARMVAQGYANKTIATILEISPFTVNTYLRRIFAKLGVPSRAAMVNALHTHK